MDFIIGNKTAIEVKSGKKITSRDHKGLLALKEENRWKHLILVSRDPVKARFKNGIQHLYWETFLKDLWKDRFF